MIIFLNNLIIHEIGHLIFGKLFGYSLLSFKIASLLIERESNNKFKISLDRSCLDSQCIMVPPKEDDTFSLIIYLLGGSFMNFLSSTLYSIFFIVYDLNVSFFSSFMIVSGILMGVLNLIPFSYTDGKTICNFLNFEKTAKYIFYQLCIEEALLTGEFLSNINPKFIELPTKNLASNYVCTPIYIANYYYFIGKKDFVEANSTLNFLWEKRNEILPDYYRIVYREKVFLNYILNLGVQDFNESHLSTPKPFIKNSTIGSLRGNIAYSLLVENNKEKAIKLFSVFISNYEKYENDYYFSIEKELIRELYYQMRIRKGRNHD